jgi:hypothetical protein
MVLDALPEPAVWDAFVANPERVLTVTNLADGRVHVACFAPLTTDHPDLRAALRHLSGVLRIDMETLRG